MVALDIFQTGVTSIKWRNSRRRPAKDSSIQFSSRWYLSTPPRLSGVSLTLPLKHFQCSSYWRYLSSFEGRALEVLLGFSTAVGSHTDSWSEILSPPSSVIAVRWVCCLLFVCVHENPTNIDINLMVIALNTYGTTSLSNWMFCCYFTVEAESIPGWFSVRSVINSSEWAFFVIYRQIRNTRCVQ